MIKAIVCGGRDFIDYEMMKSRLDIIFMGEHGYVNIVSGTAQCADKLGERYAKENDYLITQFKPNWTKFGKNAGPIRNKDMLDYIKDYEKKCVVAFWDRKSKGTKNMIDIAEKAGIKTYVFYY